jgi:hypothetical protein
MDPSKDSQLVRQHGVTKIILTHVQTFIEAGDLKPNEIEVKFDELPSIFNKFETALNELESLYNTDHSIDRRQFDDQYYYVKVRFNEFLHFILSPPRSRHSLPGRCSLDHSSSLLRLHHSGSTHIKLPIIILSTSDGSACSWLHVRYTIEALIFKNKTLKYGDFIISFHH